MLMLARSMPSVYGLVLGVLYIASWLERIIDKRIAATAATALSGVPAPYGAETGTTTTVQAVTRPVTSVPIIVDRLLLTLSSLPMVMTIPSLSGIIRWRVRRSMTDGSQPQLFARWGGMSADE